MRSPWIVVTVVATIGLGAWLLRESAPSRVTPEADSEAADATVASPPAPTPPIATLERPAATRPDSLGIAEVVGALQRSGSAAETPAGSIGSPAKRRLRALVLDAKTRAPVPGVRISVSGVEIAGRLFGLGGVSATTDTLGRANLEGIPAGELGAVLNAAGYVRMGLTECTPVEGSGAAGAGDLDATLTIAPEAVIVGKVVLPDGTPARGVVVRARRGDDDLRYPWLWGFRASDDGSFRITGLGEGTYSLTAETRRQEIDLLGRVTASAGATDVVLALAPAGTDGSVLVRVIDAAGNPVPHALVAVDLRGGTVFGEVLDGRATFGGTLDSLGYVAVWNADSADALAPSSGAVRRRFASAESGVVEVRLPTERTIAGRVVGSDGRGVEMVDLEAVAIREDRPYAASEDQHGRASSTEDGAFHIGRLGEGRYRIQARATPRYASGASAVVAAGDDSVVISLHDAAAVSVRVLDEGGRPIAGAAVRAYVGERRDAPRRAWGESRPGAGTTSEDGVVLLSALTPGEVHHLEIDPPESRLDLRPYVAGAWTAHDDTVRLPRSWIVKGTVHDRDGHPVAGAGVSAKKDVPMWDWETATTAADGSFQIGRLADENVVLFVTQSRSDFPDHGERHRVKAGGPDVSIELDVGVDVVVRVENWPKNLDGHEALLTPNARDGTSRGLRQKIGMDGVARFRGLRAADVLVLFIESLPDESCAYLAGVRANGSEVRVRLQPGKVVSGRVVAPEGSSPPSVYLQGPGLFLSPRVASDGRFEVRGVPDGEWELSCVSYVEGVPYDAESHVKAGDSSIELKLATR